MAKFRGRSFIVFLYDWFTAVKSRAYSTAGAQDLTLAVDDATMCSVGVGVFIRNEKLAFAWLHCIFVWQCIDYHGISNGDQQEGKKKGE